MKSARISYSQRSDAEAEGEVAVLSNIYRFLIHSSSKRGRLLDKSGPDDGSKTKEGSADVSSLPH
jgi:hypothetical protein